MESFQSIMERGGPVMWPLLLCSIVALTIVIERILFWWRQERKSDQTLVNRLFELTEHGEHDRAIAEGLDAKDVAVRVLCAGLVHRNYGLTEAMQVEAGNEIRRMKEGLAILDTIITLAPMLGILGTVTGIIKSFDLLGVSGIQDPRAATSGLAEALITTAAGLVVAIVTLIPFNYFVSRVQGAAKHLEQVGTQFQVAYGKSLEKRNHAP